MSAPEADVVISHVLCPTDFSTFSEAAIRQATRIATWYGARLTALSCIPTWPRVSVAFPEYGEPFISPAPEDVRSELQRFLRPAEEAGVPCDVAVVDGRPAPTIVQYAREKAADLVVMGTHGHGGFERLLLGSVTEKVLRKAPCPVLTVGPAAADERPEVARILCALDFSDMSLRALDYAASLARVATAVLNVVHVVDWPLEEGESAPRDFDLRNYRRHLADLALRRLRTTIPEALREQSGAEEITTFGRPHGAILRIAAEKHADLIVLGVHGAGSVDRTLFGSTAYHVVRGAKCPVLSVRI